MIKRMADYFRHRFLIELRMALQAIRGDLAILRGDDVDFSEIPQQRTKK